MNSMSHISYVRSSNTIHECVTLTTTSLSLHYCIVDITPSSLRGPIKHVLTIILLFTQSGTQPNTLHSFSLLCLKTDAYKIVLSSSLWRKICDGCSKVPSMPIYVNDTR